MLLETRSCSVVAWNYIKKKMAENLSVWVTQVIDKPKTFHAPFGVPSAQCPPWKTLLEIYIWV